MDRLRGASTNRDGQSHSLSLPGLEGSSPPRDTHRSRPSQGSIQPPPVLNGRRYQFTKSRLKATMLMVLGLLLGAVVAIGHHFYYARLSGKPVATTSVAPPAYVYGQDWANHIGNMLAYLVKGILSLVVAFAYVQRMWYCLRTTRDGLSISGVDDAFELLSEAKRFLSRELAKTSPTLLCIGLVAWTLPYVAIVAPGALQVTLGYVDAPSPCNIPVTDLSSTENLWSQLYPRDTVVDFWGASRNTARMLTQVLVGGTYITPTSPCGQICDYEISYVAPYFDCKNGSTGDYGEYLYAPGTADDGDDVVMWNATRLDQVWQYPDSYGLNGDPMIMAWAANNSEIDTDPRVSVCSLANATYTFHIAHNGSEHDVELTDLSLNPAFNRTVTSYAIKDTGDFSEAEPQQRQNMNFAAIAGEVFTLLGGSIAGWCERPAYDPLTINNTIVAESNFVVYTPNTTLDSETMVTTGWYPSEDMGATMHGLMVNYTFSLMTSSLPDRALLTQTASTCTRAYAQDVYYYSAYTLWAAYAVALFLTALVLLSAIHAILSNGFTGDTNFSTILDAVRNPELDSVVDKKRQGGDDSVKDVRLKYDVIEDGVRQRMGFTRVDRDADRQAEPEEEPKNEDPMYNPKNDLRSQLSSSMLSQQEPDEGTKAANSGYDSRPRYPSQPSSSMLSQQPKEPEPGLRAANSGDDSRPRYPSQSSSVLSQQPEAPDSRLKAPNLGDDSRPERPSQPSSPMLSPQGQDNGLKPENPGNISRLELPKELSSSILSLQGPDEGLKPDDAASGSRLRLLSQHSQLSSSIISKETHVRSIRSVRSGQSIHSEVVETHSYS